MNEIKKVDRYYKTIRKITDLCECSHLIRYRGKKFFKVTLPELSIINKELFFTGTAENRYLVFNGYYTSECLLEFGRSSFEHETNDVNIIQDKETKKAMVIFKNCGRLIILTDVYKVENFNNYLIPIKKRYKMIRHKDFIRYKNFLKSICTYDKFCIVDRMNRFDFPKLNLIKASNINLKIYNRKNDYRSDSVYLESMVSSKFSCFLGFVGGIDVNAVNENMLLVRNSSLQKNHVIISSKDEITKAMLELEI